MNGLSHKQLQLVPTAAGSTMNINDILVADREGQLPLTHVHLGGDRTIVVRGVAGQALWDQVWQRTDANGEQTYENMTDRLVLIYWEDSITHREAVSLHYIQRHDRNQKWLLFFFYLPF